MLPSTPLDSKGQQNTSWMLITVWVAFAIIVILLTVAFLTGAFHAEEKKDQPEIGKTECSDNRDNDNDGQIDFPKDPDCLNVLDSNESPQ